MNFPLYENLIINTKSKDLLVKEKTEMVEYIKDFDEEGKELLYGLIKCYAENHKIEASLPYKSSYIDNNFKVDIDTLPNKLKQLIYVFVIAHHKKIKEEQTRQKLIQQHE